MRGVCLHLNDTRAQNTAGERLAAQPGNRINWKTNLHFLNNSYRNSFPGCLCRIVRLFNLGTSFWQ